MTGLAGNSDHSRQAATQSRPVPVSVSVRSVRPVLGYLAAREYNTARLLHDIGIDPAELDDSEARIPHAMAVDLWDAAKQLTGDASIGIHVAESIRPGIFVLARPSMAFMSLISKPRCLRRSMTESARPQLTA